MGMFDNEGVLFETTPTPEDGPASTDTPTNDGHVESTADKTQAPVTEEKETTQATDTQTEVKTESTESTEIKEKPAKKYANRYDTQGGLVNGIISAAQMVGEEVDWSKLNSVEDMENLYLDLHRRISRGEVKNVLPVAPQQRRESPEKIQQTLQKQQYDLDQEIERIIAASNEVLQDPTLETEEDLEEFATRFLENPQAALKERDSRLEKKFEAKLNLEGAKLLKILSPVLQESQAQRAEKEGTALWDKAISNFNQALVSQGINDLEKLLPEMLAKWKNDPALIEVVDEAGNVPGVREKVLSILYRDVKLNKELHEFAKTKSEEDTATIEASKKGLKIQNGVGGGKPIPKTDDEKLIDGIFGGNQSRGMFG
jgi:hypothetical protein